jgi:AraC-like DNA-binding protein
MLKKQIFSPKAAAQRDIALISTMGLENPNGSGFRRGRDWGKQQVVHHDNFSLVMTESYCRSADTIDYTRQEDYIKVNFWLSGKHTTILDGFGQREHDRPEVFITSGPLEMLKVDVVNRDSQVAAVAVCFKRDFFQTHMDLSPDELPEPLRGILAPAENPYALCGFPLTPDSVAAARSILLAPIPLRRNPLYGNAKCLELMSLLINLLGTHNAKGGTNNARGRHEGRLYKARELLTERYSEVITLESISKEIGLNRMALTSGFRQMFNLSVYDYLQKVRMERAFELLLDRCTVADVAEAVGFGHSRNFSTAFNRYFGCSPRRIRGSVQ